MNPDKASYEKSFICRCPQFQTRLAPFFHFLAFLFTHDHYIMDNRKSPALTGLFRHSETEVFNLRLLVTRIQFPATWPHLPGFGYHSPSVSGRLAEIFQQLPCVSFQCPVLGPVHRRQPVLSAAQIAFKCSPFENQIILFRQAAICAPSGIAGMAPWAVVVRAPAALP